MATGSSAFTCAFYTQRCLLSFGGFHKLHHQNPRLLSVRATADDSDCNVEECAPDKEVGKISVEWLAGEKTKVVGTYPPRKRGWTGYVEKDTAGQTNIYSVEPAVYVAESAISSGTAGSSSDGSENTLAKSLGVGFISVALASLVLLLVSKNSPPVVQTADYNGPSLGYYINKFKPEEIIEASAPSSEEPAPSAPAPAPLEESTSEPQIQVDQVEPLLSDNGLF